MADRSPDPPEIPKPRLRDPDLPLVIETKRDLSKLPAGPMNLDWIGFTPAGYQPHPVRKQLPRDVAERLLKDWYDWGADQREPVYTTPASTRRANAMRNRVPALLMVSRNLSP